MLFWLGTHQPSWLRQTNVPLFLSATRLRSQLWSNVASGPWACDSGGFTEITRHGKYLTPASTYAEEVKRWQKQMGYMAFASIQDWMCEPLALGRSGLTVKDHQRFTIDSYNNLRELAPDVPWLPVLQGWSLEDYLDHVRQYRRQGTDLRDVSLVGLGSICRRQATKEAEAIIIRLTGYGVRLHGFGFKILGLRRVGHLLMSADSMAWSLDARRRPPMPGHAVRHKNCSNCIEYALSWRERVIDQLTLHGGKST